MVSENERLDIGKAYYKDGFEDGYKGAKIEDAKAMLTDGVSPDKISLYTGLSAEELKAL